MNLNFIILLGAFIAGAMFAVMISGLIFTSNNADGLDIPPKIGISKLKRHDIQVAILMDRFGEDPEETIKRVKKDFANEIVRLIDDSIEVMPDHKTRHFIFTITIWTKEAADDKDNI